MLDYLVALGLVELVETRLLSLAEDDAMLCHLIYFIYLDSYSLASTCYNISNGIE